VPFRIRIDKQKRLIVSTFTGIFSPNELIDGRNALAENPDFDATFAHIIDLSRVTKLDMEGLAVAQLSRERTIFEKDSVQVIVASEKLKFEFAKSFKTKSATERPFLEVTRSMEAAYALIALHKAEKPG
jgi:di/tripeptidase